MRRQFLVALAVLAAATASSSAPTVSDLISRVPSSARVIVAADLATLRTHPDVAQWLAEHQGAWTGELGEPRDFLLDAGIDPTRDIDTMVVAVVPDASRPHFLACFAGRYDPASLGRALTNRGAQQETIAGTSVYRLTDHGCQQGLLVAVSPDLVMIGDDPTLAVALAGGAGGNDLLEGEIAAGHVDLGASVLVVAAVPADGRAAARQAAEPVFAEGGEPIRDAILASGTVKRISVSATLGAALVVKAWATTDTPENAALLRDTLKGALAAVRLEVQGRRPELVDALRAVEVRQEGTAVSATGAVPLAVLETLGRESGHPLHPN